MSSKWMKDKVLKTETWSRPKNWLLNGTTYNNLQRYQIWRHIKSANVVYAIHNIFIKLLWLRKQLLWWSNFDYFFNKTEKYWLPICGDFSTVWQRDRHWFFGIWNREKCIGYFNQETDVFLNLALPNPFQLIKDKVFKTKTQSRS